MLSPQPEPQTSRPNAVPSPYGDYVAEQAGRRPIYTGWKVVGASAALWALQSMLWMQGFGNLAVELRRQFGWSKTLFSFAFVGTRTGIAFIGPAQGTAIVRWGTKRIMRVGAIFVLVGYVGLSQIETKTHFFLAMTVAAFGMSLAGFLTITAALVQWFERKRARALSMQTMGFALGGFAGPLLVVGFGWFGWRPTMVGAGIVLAFAIYAASGVIGTDRSSSNEPIDGIPPEQLGATPKAQGVHEIHFTAHQAMRTRAFWMISLGHGSALVVVSATIAHIALYLTEDRGFNAKEAALIAGAIPVFQMIGTATGGYFGDRVNKRIIVGIAMCAHAIGLLLMTWVDSSVAIGIFVVLHGLAWGARGPLMQAIRADYFGTTHFAQIMGWSSIVITLGTVAGPLLAGILADSTGNYRLGFTIVALLALAGNVFWALASPPPPLQPGLPIADEPRFRPSASRAPWPRA
jgi:OFA family oxalate/formate antiporter-like MFS transporter